jgi:hypothetical protein
MDRRTERFKETVRDIIGGSPEDVYLAKIERHEGGSGGPVA